MPTTNDFNFMPDTVDSVEIPLVFDNKVCSGPFKLAQRILTLLFNSKETALMPFMGTDAILYINGNVQSESEIQNQMNIAADRVQEVIKAYEDPSAPDNEKLDSFSVLVNVDDVVRDHVSLTLNVKTISGDAITAQVPSSLPIVA